MHVAIIMDGNRRWAKNHQFQTFLGHQNGVKALEKILAICPDLGINTLTVYALSGENLVKRNENEVSDIFRIMIESLRMKKRQLIGENIRIRILGKMSNLPQKLQDSLAELVDKTKSCTKFVLQICLNYSGREEIVEATKNLIKEGIEITSENIDKILNYPQVDLLIRPGGEMRLSNFLLYKSSYAELYFTETLWPDFDQKELQKAMNWYKERNRRFGK